MTRLRRIAAGLALCLAPVRLPAPGDRARRAPLVAEMVALRAAACRLESGTITGIGRWAVAAAGLDLVTKLLAAQLHQRGVLPRLIVGTTNPVA